MSKQWHLDSSEQGAAFAPSLETVMAVFHRLSSAPGRASRDLSLFLDEDRDAGALLSVCFDDLSSRYFLTVRDEDDLGVWVLTDGEQPDGEVEAVIGGEMVTEEQRHLVSKEAAESAIKFFFESGRKSPDLLWDEC